MLLGVLAFLMFSDEKELEVPADINLYAPTTESGIEAFENLMEIFSRQFPYKGAPSQLFNGRLEREEVERLLIENKLLIIENYGMLNTVLSDLKALNAYDNITDNSEGFDSELMLFSPIRSISQVVSLYTRLQFFAGANERSLEDLLLLREVLSKWIPNSRCLVHYMIASVILNQINETIEEIFPFLSSEELIHLESVFATPVDYPKYLETALYAEYCMAAAALDGMIAEAKGGLGFLLFKRNHTLNIYGDYIKNAVALAKSEEHIPLRELYDDLDTKLSVTNLGGTTFLRMAVPAISGVFKSSYEYRENENRLLLRLRESIESEKGK